MSTFTVDYNRVIAGGAGYSIALNNDLIVLQNASIAADSNNLAIVMAGHNHISLRGVAIGYSAFYEGFGAPDGSVITVTATGRALGVTYGGFLDGGTAVNNSGLISGNMFGLYYQAAGTNVINNWGTIQANAPVGDTAIYFSFGGLHKILNAASGVITNLRVGQFAITGKEGIEQITNNGHINGIIELGNGNDLYDGHLGHHTGGAIFGQGGQDVIKTGVEADVIQGGDDNDVILAGAGNNSIKGGWGKDTMAGGVNVDVFYFGEVLDSGVTAATRDVIIGFKHGVDKINLVGIDAVQGGANTAFVFNAARATAASLVAAGHVAWYWEDNAGTGNDHTIIKLNNDADAAIDMTMQLNGLITLTATDFVL